MVILPLRKFLATVLLHLDECSRSLGAIPRAKGVMSILLSPRHPLWLLQRTTRTLSILSSRMLSFLKRSDMDDNELRALLERIAPVAHTRDSKRARWVVDSDKRVPLTHDEWTRWVNTEAHLLAGRVERVTVTERDDAQRITRAWWW